ncbi:MAG: hypothetical protein JXR42_01945 [Gammaproteobacteria bacterium]|nr:hypothetical protein [Gammaproteobacteria bacterium]
MKTIIYLLPLSSLLLAGCASTTSTVYPQGNNSYTVITTSSAADNAASAAMKKANKVCAMHRKNIIVKDHYVKYQGAISRKNKEIVNTATEIAGSLSKTFIPGMTSDTDYKAVVKFSCK